MDTTPAPDRKRHVLVVDDNLELAQTYQRLFEERGHAASVAPNGVLALKTLLATDVDAVVCDLKMPQLEGDMFYVTVQRVKPHLCNRFVFVTGMAADPKFQAFVKQVAAPVLFKPVPFEELLQAVEGVLAKG
jgi:CheY-like chemotaxis protein